MTKTLYFLYDGETISNPVFFTDEELAEAEEQLCADGAVEAYCYVASDEVYKLSSEYLYPENQE